MVNIWAGLRSVSYGTKERRVDSWPAWNGYVAATILRVHERKSGAARPAVADTSD